GRDHGRDGGARASATAAAARAGAAPPRAAPDPSPGLLPAARARSRAAGGRRTRDAGRGVGRVKCATRAHCHIDRTPCAGLVRRFIAADAEFVFVDARDDVPEDATPFDMRGVQLSHHRGNCSFETFLERYELDDPVLWELARIVHEADLADDRYDAPEA